MSIPQWYILAEYFALRQKEKINRRPQTGRLGDLSFVGKYRENMTRCLSKTVAHKGNGKMPYNFSKISRTKKELPWVNRTCNPVEDQKLLSYSKILLKFGSIYVKLYKILHFTKFR